MPDLRPIGPLPRPAGCGKTGQSFNSHAEGPQMSAYSARRVMMVDTQVRPQDVTKFPIIEAMRFSR